MEAKRTLLPETLDEQIQRLKARHLAVLEIRAYAEFLAAKADEIELSTRDDFIGAIPDRTTGENAYASFRALFSCLDRTGSYVGSVPGLARELAPAWVASDPPATVRTVTETHAPAPAARIVRRIPAPPVPEVREGFPEPVEQPDGSFVAYDVRIEAGNLVKAREIQERTWAAGTGGEPFPSKEMGQNFGRNAWKNQLAKSTYEAGLAHAARMGGASSAHREHGTSPRTRPAPVGPARAEDVTPVPVPATPSPALALLPEPEPERDEVSADPRAILSDATFLTADDGDEDHADVDVEDDLSPRADAYVPRADDDGTEPSVGTYDDYTFGEEDDGSGRSYEGPYDHEAGDAAVAAVMAEVGGVPSPLGHELLARTPDFLSEVDGGHLDGMGQHSDVPVDGWLRPFDPVQALHATGPPREIRVSTEDPAPRRPAFT